MCHFVSYIMWFQTIIVYKTIASSRSNKVSFQGSYDHMIDNLTLAVISYEIRETREGTFHKFHIK